MPEGERAPATEAQSKALASSTRLRILRLCLSEALTNKEIAARLHRHPASVLHHVRTLVDTGFLAAQPARRGTRGAREVPYLATGLSWTVELGETARRRTDPLLAAFLEELVEAGAGVLDSTRLGLRLPPEQVAEFRARLFDIFDEFARRPMDPHGQRWSVYLGMHPEPGPESD